jgi:CHASE3 domain sensor protein
MNEPGKAPSGGGRWHIPPKRVVLWSAIVALPMAVLVALGGYLSYHSHTLLKQSRDRVDRTYEVLDTLNRLFIALEDAEAGQLGFIITGDAGYLGPFQFAMQALPDRSARLAALLADSPRQTEAARRLQAAAQAKLEQLGHTLDVRRERGFEAARSELATTQGKTLMDAVRNEVNAIALAEQESLRRGQVLAEARERQILKIGVAIAGLSIALRVGIAFALPGLRRRGQLAESVGADRPQPAA